MKTLAKQILFGLLALALTLSLVACGGDGDTTATTTAGGDDVVTTTSTDGEQADTTTTTVSGSSQASGSSSSNNVAKTTTTKAQQSSSSQGLSWAEVKASMPANLNGTTITFFNWNPMNSITDAEKVINNFTKETGITVKWEEGVYSTYVTEIAAKQAAKNAPDIVRQKDINPALMAMLQPLSNLSYDFSDAAWDQALLDAYTYKGKVYAVNMADTLMQQPDVLMYNTSLITKYDLEDPYTLWKKGQWTWSKFVEICTAFKDEAGENYGAYSVNMFTNGAQLLGADYVTYTQDGFVNGMGNKKLLQGLQMFLDLKDKDLIAGSYLLEPFESGSVLFFADGIIGARKTHFYFTDLKAKNSLGVVPNPTIDGQSTYYQIYRELEAYSIPTGAKNAAAVPYFLRYWLDASNYTKNTFFANQKVLEVYNYCMSQENIMVTYSASNVLTKDTGASNLSYMVQQSSSAQVATLLNQYKNVVESAVRQANSKLSSTLG